jgi:YegS/Rv2252/BmrU family lipid kinase
MTSFIDLHSPMPRRALLLINPGARRGDEAADQAVAGLEAQGLDVLPVTSLDPKDLADIIVREKGRIDRVVVAGGDGTLNAAVQGLVGSGLPLAVLPLGTANNLARTLRLPGTLEGACEVAAHGARRSIDLGWVNGRYFFTTASMGLSVHISEALTPKTKQRWGALAYGVAALRAATRARPFQAEIRWKGGERHSRTLQIVVGNGRYYGSALPVAEDAEIDDSRLDLYSLEVKHWLGLIGLVPALRRGRHGQKRSVEALRATDFEIQTAVPLKLNVDGEIWGETPAVFRVVPRALEVFAPVEPA